jgi:hypothetical protein
MNHIPDDAFENSVRALSNHELRYLLEVARDEMNRRLLAILGEPIASDGPATPSRIPALERARAFQDKKKEGAGR